MPLAPPAVNPGNVAAADVIGVKTLRRGLRGDTLLDLTAVTAADPLRPSRPGRPLTIGAGSLRTRCGRPTPIVRRPAEGEGEAG
jgi:hypothetical protein